MNEAQAIRMHALKVAIRYYEVSDDQVSIIADARAIERFIYQGSDIDLRIECLYVALEAADRILSKSVASLDELRRAVKLIEKYGLTGVDPSEVGE